MISSYFDFVSQNILGMLCKLLGIWLHALKYEGIDWSFETDYPFWATGFEFQGEH